MEKKHIEKIIQYWGYRESLETEISKIREKYYYGADLTDSEKEEWGYKLTNKGYVKANRKLDEKIEILTQKIKKLDKNYENWLIEKLGLTLNDRTQDEFTYNLINNGVVINT